MENPFNTDNTPKRSTLLTVLLVLTFIYSGLSFISNSYVSLFTNQVIEFVEYLADDDAMATVATVLEQSVRTIEKFGSLGYGLVALLYLVSLIGAYLMWKLNKHGFHFYAAAQIVLLLTPMLFGTAKFPTLFPIMITAFFIFMYARELKVFEKTTEE